MKYVVEKRCPKCGLMLKAESFHKHKGRADGLSSECKSCHLLWKASRRFEVSVTEQKCSKCLMVLPASSFSKDRYRRAGLQVHCIKCNSLYMKERYRQNVDARNRLYQHASARDKRGVECATRSRAKWTAYEDAYIFTDGITMTEMAYTLGRSYRGVRDRRQKLRRAAK